MNAGSPPKRRCAGERVLLPEAPCAYSTGRSVSAMPASPAADTMRFAISAGSSYRRPVAVVVQIVELRDRRVAVPQHLDVEVARDRLDVARARGASRGGTSPRATSRNRRSDGRGIPRGPPSRAGTRASGRWRCREGPGPAALACAPRSLPAATREMIPPSSHSTRTSRAQPEGSSASEAKREPMKFSMIPAMTRTLLMNARIATMRGGRYSMIDNGAMRIREGRIEWIGPVSELSRGEAEGRRGDRREGRARHARPDRLPHAPRLRGRPRARVRDAACGARAMPRSPRRAAASSPP